MTGLLAFAFWPEVKKLVDRNLGRAIEKYTHDPDLRNMIDKLQREVIFKYITIYVVYQ